MTAHATFFTSSQQSKKCHLKISFISATLVASIEHGILDKAGVDQGDDLRELYALVEKLSDIADDINHKRRRFEQLALDIRRMDSAIRIKSAGMDRDEPPKVPVNASERSIPSLVMDILAEAQDPMTSREVALGIMRLRGLDVANAPVRNRIIHRVSEAMWVQMQKRLVRKAEPGASPIRWELGCE